MAKSLVLHIGDPKTGSSSIQEVMFKRLFDSQDVKVAYPAQLSSFPLSASISDAKQQQHREARFTRLAAWLGETDADVAVVSAEQFFRVDPKALLDTLNEFLPAYVPDLRIIAYVRPHASRFLSAYMQRTKAGLIQGSMMSFFDQTKGDNLLRYAPRFQKWRDVFGDRFTLRPFIRNQLRDGDVVADFLDFTLKGAPFKLHGTVEANISMPLEQLVGLGEVQAILKRNVIQIGTRHAVGDHVNRSLAKTQGTKLQLSTAMYNNIKTTCAADAEALDAAFFDSPLMTQALQDAAADAIADDQDLRPKTYYSEEALTALRNKARRLVAMFKKRPAAWTMAFEREIGQRMGSSDAKPPPPPVRAHNEKVNAVLTEIADLIANPRAQADK